MLLVPGEEESAAGNRCSGYVVGVKQFSRWERSVGFAESRREFVYLGRRQPRTGGPGEESAAEPDEARIGILAAFVERRAGDD